MPTCVGVYKFPRALDLDSPRILLYKFDYLVNIFHRQVVLGQESLGGRVRVLYSDINPQERRIEVQAHTCSIVGQGKWGRAILDVNLEDIIIFFAFIKLLPILANRVHNLSNLGPFTLPN